MYVLKRGTTYYFEYEFRRQRVRKGGFPTRTLARLAGQEDQRQRREDWITLRWGVRDPRKPWEPPSLRKYIQIEYVPNHLPQLQPSTQKTAKSQIKKLLRYLGSTPLDALTPLVMDRFTRIRLRTVSGAQVREEVARLSRILNHARARGILKHHPYQGWKRPRALPRDFRVLEPVEEVRLLRATPQEFVDWVALALDTGLRKGELRVLKTHHVHYDEIRIQQPKTRRVKIVPLTPRAAAIIRRRSIAGHTYLLGQPDGKCYSLAWIDRRWDRLRRAADLTGIRFHDLRHTFATRLAEAGVSVAVVGELLGHKPPYTMTLRYFHALPEAKREAIRRLGMRGTSKQALEPG